VFPLKVNEAEISVFKPGFKLCFRAGFKSSFLASLKSSFLAVLSQVFLAIGFFSHFFILLICMLYFEACLKPLSAGLSLMKASYKYLTLNI
jgi:hypothetical protein